MGTTATKPGSNLPTGERLSRSGTLEIELLIAHPQSLMSDLMANALDEMPDISVVGIANDTETAVQIASERTPTAALLTDGPSEALSAIALGLQLKKALPGLGVVAISNDASVIPSADSLFSSGPGWCCMIGSSIRSAQDLAGLLRSAVAGLTIIDPGLLPQNSDKGRRMPRLTPKQKEVLDLVACGYSNDHVAEKLGLSTRTVEYHLMETYRHMGLADNPALNRRMYAALTHLGHLVDGGVDGGTRSAAWFGSPAAAISA